MAPAKLDWLATAREDALFAVFLASAQSQYITAQTLSVDGGNVLR